LLTTPRSIAETSVTIDDVVVVIDTGKMNEMQYDPGTFPLSANCSGVGGDSNTVANCCSTTLSVQAVLPGRDVDRQIQRRTATRSCRPSQEGSVFQTLHGA
jgi:hypothetical protein